MPKRYRAHIDLVTCWDISEEDCEKLELMSSDEERSNWLWKNYGKDVVLETGEMSTAVVEM